MKLKITNLDKFSLDNYFSLGRALDWGYPSNRFAIVVTAITFFFYLAYSIIFYTGEVSSLKNILYAFQIAMLSFGTWAIAREFDPKDPLTAMVAQLITSASFVFIFSVNALTVLPLFLILLGARYLNGITGKESKITDMILILIFGAGLSFATENWIYALISAMAFALNIFFKEKFLKDLIFALIGVAISVYFIYPDKVLLYEPDIPPLLRYFLLLSFILTLISRFILNRKIEQKCDKGSKLNSGPIIGGAALITISFLLLTFFVSNNAYYSAIPFWSLTVAYPFISIFNKE